MRRTARAATPTGDLRDRALASMDQAVVIADAAQQGFPTVYVNPAFERMTGWSQRQILGPELRRPAGPRHRRRGRRRAVGGARRGARGDGHAAQPSAATARRSGTAWR